MLDSTSEPAVNEDCADDLALNLTQQVRHQIIATMTHKGVPVSDPEAMTILLKTMDGMDKVALGKKRIKVDEGTANAGQAAAAAIIARVLQAASNASNKPYTSTVPVNREIPTLSLDVPRPMLVSGEIDIAPTQMTYDVFMAENVHIPD